MQAYDASLTPADRKELGRGIYIVLRRRKGGATRGDDAGA